MRRTTYHEQVAREPVQYVVSDGARRLGVLTDSGCSTPHVEEMLSGCEALVLEANHDLDMLWRGDYPQSLKARIAGRPISGTIRTL